MSSRGAVVAATSSLVDGLPLSDARLGRLGSAAGLASRAALEAQDTQSARLACLAVLRGGGLCAPELSDSAPASAAVRVAEAGLLRMILAGCPLHVAVAAAVDWLNDKTGLDSRSAADAIQQAASVSLPLLPASAAHTVAVAACLAMVCIDVAAAIDPSSDPDGELTEAFARCLLDQWRV